MRDTGRLRAALAGNPNSGKTSLFNALTGANQQVGNWPGVTVEKKEGRYYHEGAAVLVTDLPGTYSLDPSTPEQKIARDFIESEGADVIINVTDATNLLRSMFLTIQLTGMGIPMVVAVNFMDEAEKAGVEVDFAKLSDRLGAKVVPISAASGEGIAELKKAVSEAALGKAPKALFSCSKLCSGCSAALEGFSCVDSMFSDCIRRPESKARMSTLDRIVLNKWLALPVFFLVMAAVFMFTFGPVVSKVSELIDLLVNRSLPEAFKGLMANAGLPAWLTGLVADGAIGGAGAVVVFLPQIVVLFLLLSLLEGSGYMARAAFVMDRALSWLGLSGRSFVTLLMGFGCTVPAIMASRILEDDNERRLSVVVAPFMSCSARMPIYVLIAGAFFGRSAGLVAASMYFIGLAVMVASAFVLSRTVFKGGHKGTFVLEMPPYRMPRLNYLIIATWHKTKDFIIRAGTLIVLVSMVVWALGHFNMSFAYVDDPSASMLAMLGRLVAPLLAPLGFGEWRIAVALISGVAAKEIVASTITLLAGTGPAALASLGLNTASAFAFMVFSLLYVPCSATIVVMSKELGSARRAAAAIAYGLIVAWIAAFIAYKIGSLLSG